MRAYLAGIALIVGFANTLNAAGSDPEPAKAGKGCLKCHDGIEQIRESGSKMLRQILSVGRVSGDPGGCVVCHGGDPAAEDEKTAHQGPTFYPDPGSPWINENTCGQCHEEHVRVQWHSLMMTEAGKIHGVTWTFGGLTGYEHRWGNYAVQNPDNLALRLGTEDYRNYMARLTERESQVFVDAHEALPLAPKDLSDLAEHPEKAAFTYLRNQCLRCHHAVKGRSERGDYRGMGCSSCHIPYSNEGLYEGDDPKIPRDEPGHCLVHSIQATREAKVVVHGTRYSGIPVETCTTCHDRGKRIGVSFQGLMEIPYESPYTEGGEGQPTLHTKHYMAMHQDIHYQKGMTCQDCHTSIDVHSDGCLAAANLGAVQIECADCHGTPAAYPWELPLGFGDEYEESPASGPARGTSSTLTRHVQQGTVYPVQDGYLLTARGNPFSNVVRDGYRVIVHTAAGNDLTLKPLKEVVRGPEVSLAAKIAMDTITPHMNKMECYSCHAAWAPQCYGCHVKIDYSQGKTCFDWLEAGHQHEQPEHAADRGESQFKTLIPGSIQEQRSFTRWEDPPLGVNGEGRITPIAPGCQPSITIIGPDGKAVVGPGGKPILNHIFRTPPDSEGAGPEGQLAIDMSPTQPHTMTGEARTCESCHLSDKALGYGIGSSKMTRRPDQPVIVDLRTIDGHILPENRRTQIEAIDGLEADWSRVVTEDGRQLQTVGHHFKGSRPLNDEERGHMDRRGVCLACHQEIPDRSLAVSLLHHVAEYADQLPKTAAQHDSLIHKLLLATAWVQVGGAGAVPVVFLGVILVWWARRRAKRKRKEFDDLLL